MAWGEITEDALSAAAELIGKPLRRSRMQWIETATRDAIRHFAWGIGDNNPLWLDPDYAENAPAGCLLGPPCILYAVDSTIVAPKLPGVQWIYAGTDWIWYDHIRIDDHFRVEAELTDQEVKTGRRFSRWVLQSGEIRYFNQHDRLVAKATGKCARTPRNTGSGSGNPTEAYRYSPPELAAIEKQVLSEPRQGAAPLYWEDVDEGDTIPPVIKGPLTITDIVAWYAATQGAVHYGGAHGDALRYRLRHHDYHINPDTGAKDSAGRGHFEAKTAQDVGMGGVYDVGLQRISWAQHMLTNWIGDHGFLHRLNVSVRRPNHVGDTLWWCGKIEDKFAEGRTKFVTLQVEAKNQRDELSASGTATVVLPSRHDGPVPLPLMPA